MDAAKKLLKKIPYKESLTVVSLLRGGVIIGDILAKKLHCPHLPLVVAKIPSPHNPELAIGAVCFDTAYLEKTIVDSLHLKKSEITDQIKTARKKFDSYCKTFGIKESIYQKIGGKNVILTDDGIATGSTVRTALLYLKSKSAAKIVLAAPVAPIDFSAKGFDEVVILYRDPDFHSVSQFYQNFPQIETEEVKQILNSK